ncbi:succinate dehydrogenase cytochrome b subunit [Nocardioides terrisoli]|uniref:succinate dehydrogenase cytochrome b subunit n=1 Tax=Nocardioides terrisoli TaxID=3388267 RepID=UPI00287B6C19|nr:succinate dehydrogenase cytochrome b subunit [Nocardioides marmorisolisilvae]
MATQIQSPTLVKGARGSQSTIALKLLMATSGIIFILFVLAHMYGNLKAFAGHDAYDTYAAHLRTIGEPMLPHEGFLWVMRAVLLLSLVVHVACAVVLWRRARAARPVRYQVKKHVGATFASRLMRWGGVTILLFVIWHLLEFTIVKINVRPDQLPTDRHDPFLLLVDSFNVWWITLIYVVAMAMLGAHLHHGIWSACQTLGWTLNTRSRRLARQIAFVLALIISVGFVAVPIFIAAGVITKTS